MKFFPAIEIEHAMTMNAPFNTQQYFSGYYRASSGDEAARLRYAAIAAQVFAVLDRQPGALNVADVGCGAGAQCRYWAQQGHQVYGVDIDAALIGRARERAREWEREIMFDIACASALPWPDRSMNVVLATGVLKQVGNWHACLAELVRVVTPGGLLYLRCGRRRCSPRPDDSGPTLPALRAALAGHGLATLTTRAASLLAVKAGSTNCCPGPAGNGCCCARTG